MEIRNPVIFKGIGPDGLLRRKPLPRILRIPSTCILIYNQWALLTHNKGLLSPGIHSKSGLGNPSIWNGNKITQKSIAIK